MNKTKDDVGDSNLSLMLHLSSHAGGDAIRTLYRHLMELQRLRISESDPISLVAQDVLLLTEELGKIAADFQTFNTILDEGSAAINQTDQLIQRYVSVSDPVVASDGFTYERESIEEYLDGCSKASATPVSQQDGSPLSSTLVPNKTLQHLISQLEQIGKEHQNLLDGELKESSVEFSKTSTDEHDKRLSTMTIGKRATASASLRQQPLMPTTPIQNLKPQSSVWGSSNASQHLFGEGSNLAQKGNVKVTAKSSTAAAASAGAKSETTSSRHTPSEPVQNAMYSSPPTLRKTNQALRGLYRSNNPSASSKRPKLHPCIRVYGLCHYQDRCNFALYPYDACLNHLKKKCRFGKTCGEPHVEYQGPQGPQQQKS